MYPASGEYGLVTRPFFPGTGVPYFKFAEEALAVTRLAVRVLRSLGGVSDFFVLAEALPLEFPGLWRL